MTVFRQIALNFAWLNRLNAFMYFDAFVEDQAQLASLGHLGLVQSEFKGAFRRYLIFPARVERETHSLGRAICWHYVEFEIELIFSKHVALNFKGDYLVFKTRTKLAADELILELRCQVERVRNLVVVKHRDEGLLGDQCHSERVH